MSASAELNRYPAKPMGASFKLPADLLVLIDAGVWPTPDNELKQHLTPTAPTDAIKRFAADEDNLYLYPPSFRTVASHAKLNGFWGDHAAPEQLDFNNALVLGDFGLGSDAPIVLDYSDNRDHPSVKRLQWHAEGNCWVKVCETFSEFANLLGLLPA